MFKRRNKVIISLVSVLLLSLVALGLNPNIRYLADKVVDPNRKPKPRISLVKVATKRIGDCPTCDVKTTDQANPVMISSTISSWGQPTSTDTTSSQVFRGDLGYWYLSKYDLTPGSTGIPSNAVIRSAKLRIFTPSSYGAKAVNEPIYSLAGTGIGLWSGQNLDYNYKNTTTTPKTEWSNCTKQHPSDICDFSTISALLTTRPRTTSNSTSMYFNNRTPSGYNTINNYREADLTDMVKGWVSDSNSNLGFTMKANTDDPNFNLTIAGRNYKGTTNPNDPEYYLRPYLEITYEGTNDEVIAQAADTSAVYHSGQTFITWDEATTGKDETSYKIYRSNKPIVSNNLDDATQIGQVYQGSSYVGDFRSDYNNQTGYYQPNLSPAGVALKHFADDGSGVESGLFVYTDRQTQGSVYYAVTTVVEGDENRTDFSTNSLTNPISEVQSSADIQPDFFYYAEGKQVEGNINPGYSKYVMWLSDFNPKDPSDTYGFTNNGSMPYTFSLVLPQKEVPKNSNQINDWAELSIDNRINRTAFQLDDSEKYPVTVYLHSIGKGSDNSSEGMSNSYCDNPNNMTGNCSTTQVGGFTISFEDINPLFVRNAQNKMDPLGVVPPKVGVPITNYIETPEGFDYYLGNNSNYVPTTIGTNGLIKTFQTPKPYTEGRSVLYTEKAIRFIIENLQDKSPWAKNIDKQRLYMTGASLGGGGSLYFAIHNPDLVTAVDLNVARSWSKGDIASNKTNSDTYDLVSWGTPTENIKTQPGVGGIDGEKIYDYLNMGEYIKAHKNLDFPIIRMTNGVLDTTIPWIQQTPVFYQAANEAKLSLTAYFMYANHNYKYPPYAPTALPPSCYSNDLIPTTDSLFYSVARDYIDNTALSYSQSSFYWNYFKFRTNQSYPAFSNFSDNGTPGVIDSTKITCDPKTWNTTSGDKRGAINRYETWDTTNIVDTKEKYSINLSLYSKLPQFDISKKDSSDTTATIYSRNINMTETADITLRRLQKFNVSHIPNITYKYWNLPIGKSIAGVAPRTIKADSNGLITINNVVLSKIGSTLTLVLADTVSGGAISSGSTTGSGSSPTSGSTASGSTVPTITDKTLSPGASGSTIGGKDSAIEPVSTTKEVTNYSWFDFNHDGKITWLDLKYLVLR